MSPPAESLLDSIDRIRERDPRYRREAYLFVVGALALAVDRLPADRRADPERRHLHGQEVLVAAIELARREFGPLAATVFDEWGVTESRQLGEIVFQLVEAGQLSARDEDRIDDFAGGPELRVALASPPARALRPSGGV